MSEADITIEFTTESPERIDFELKIPPVLMPYPRPLTVRELQVGDEVKLAEGGQAKCTVIEIERLEFNRTIVTVRYDKPPVMPFMTMRIEQIRVWLWETTYLDQWEDESGHSTTGAPDEG